MDSLEIVVPEGSFGEPETNTIAGALRELTKRLQGVGIEADSSCGLGGEYGYGVNYETDTFLIHRYCWCERDDCPWCAGCTCPETAFHYFVDGQEVAGFREWMAFYDQQVYGVMGYKDFADHLKRGPKGETPQSEEEHRRWGKLSSEANARRSERHDPDCDYCYGRGMFEVYGQGGRGAPNFWHKASGFKVWWYKWIGRSMEMSAVPPNVVQVILSCHGG